MRTINLNTQEGVDFLLFPDNQPHVNLPSRLNNKARVICSMTDSLKVIQLLQVAEALDGEYISKEELHIPYLMAARYDRRINPGDSFDLKVISHLINDCGFKKVYLYDVHSDVATALINHSTNVSNKFLVDEYDIPNSMLICPDAGAAKKINKYLEWNKNLADVLYCHKERNVRTGDVKVKIMEPEKTPGRDCVIIDDICDGGATFLNTAKKLSGYKTLTLIVTHGIFSKGFKELEKYFTQIITSDSLQKSYESRIVKQINIKYATLQ